MNKILKNATIFISIVLIVLVIYTSYPSQNSVTELNYSEFLMQVEAGQIKEVNIAAENEVGRYTITGTLADGHTVETVAFPDPAISTF